MTFSSFLPNRIAAQIALLVVAAIAAFHLLVSITLLLLRPIPDLVPPTIDAAISLTRLLSVLPDQSRAEVAAHAAAVDNHLQSTLLAPSIPILPSKGGADVEYLRNRLGPGIEVESAGNLFDRSGQSS